MAFKFDTIKKKLSNARTRTFVLLFGGLILVGIIIAIMRGTGGKQSDIAKEGSQAMAVPATIKSTPGSIVTSQYRDLQVKENEQRAKAALNAKTSAIPTIIGGVSESEARKNALTAGLEGNTGFAGAEGEAGALAGGNNPFGPGGRGGVGGANGSVGGPFSAANAAQAALDKQRAEQEARLREQRDHLDQIRLDKERQAALERQRQAQEKSNKEYQASVHQMAAQMKSYAGGAYNEWSKVTAQQYVTGIDLDSLKVVAAPTKPVLAGVTTTTLGGKVIKAKPRVFIKAGTVLFAVVETAINSDIPGPVLATIVSGKLNGTRLIGNFQHEAQQEGLVIQFNQMSIPKRIHSMSIQAVAIDADTARTAIATDVDRHILLRYGSIFASAFIQGYGQAITQQGTTTVSPLTGTTTTSTPTLNNQQIFFAALGQVGTKWGAAIQPYFNTPYTVTVDQGTGIGVLFLTDVDVTEEAMNG